MLQNSWIMCHAQTKITSVQAKNQISISFTAVHVGAVSCWPKHHTSSQNKFADSSFNFKFFQSLFEFRRFLSLWWECQIPAQLLLQEHAHGGNHNSTACANAPSLRRFPNCLRKTMQFLIKCRKIVQSCRFF